MATHSTEHMAEQVTIVATSGDPEAVGNAASFSHPVVRLNLEDPQMWALTMIDVDYRHPATDTSVYVYTNLVASSRVGSANTNALYRIPPQPAGRQHYTQLSTVVDWKRLAIGDIARLEIELRDSSGVLIPVSAGDYTTVTIAIRRR